MVPGNMTYIMMIRWYQLMVRASASYAADYGSFPYHRVSPMESDKNLTYVSVVITLLGAKVLLWSSGVVYLQDNVTNSDILWWQQRIPVSVPYVSGNEWNSKHSWKSVRSGMALYVARASDLINSNNLEAYWALDRLGSAIHKTVPFWHIVDFEPTISNPGQVKPMI